MKKSIALLLICIMTLLPFGGIVNASGDTAIHSINIDVNLQDDGSAIISQVWDVEKYEGTEFFIVQENFRHGEVISDFKVVDENGTVFTDMGRDWDVDGDIDDKAYKSGINETYDGLELCWGVGDYGAHKYVIEYKMTNVVNAYSDYDGFNMRFINDEIDPSPESFSLTIRKEGVTLTAENSGIWNFGNRGFSEFKDGVIHINSIEELEYYHHLTVLLRLDKGIVSPHNIYSKSFDVMKDEALRGSDYAKTDGSGGDGFVSQYDDHSRAVKESRRDSGGFGFVGIISVFMPLLIFGGIGSIFASSMRYGKKVNVGGKTYGAKPENFSQVMRGIDKNEYYQAAPVDSYLPAIFYAYRYSGGSALSESDMIAAYMLKWVNEKRLTAEKFTEVKDRFLLPDKTIEENRLVLKTNSDIEDRVERELWSMLVQAAGPDRILQEKEFETWSKNNSETMIKWADSIIDAGFRYFYNNGMVKPTKSKSSYTVVEFTPEGIDAVRSIYGFKKFLSEYTIINERAVQEVELWDDYLILATAYGIGEEVLKELNALSPDYVFGGDYSGSNMDTYIMYRMMTSYARSSYSGYRYSESEQATRSSGGGGFGSFGGGGGFSGGGSGGGSR